VKDALGHVRRTPLSDCRSHHLGIRAPSSARARRRVGTQAEANQEPHAQDDEDLAYDVVDAGRVSNDMHDEHTSARDADPKAR
jgi:hypothetical protein